MQPELERLRRQLLIGLNLPRALSLWKDDFGSAAAILCALTDLHLRLGGDVAATMESLADEIERRAEAEGTGRAHTAGARLSARMVALLPLVFVPLVPAVSAGGGGPADLAAFLGGVGLALVGMRWVARLMPESPSSDEVAMLATVAGAALRAGVSWPAVWDAFAGCGLHLTPHLQAVSRVGALTGRWTDSLAASRDEGLRMLGQELRAAERLGSAMAPTLDRFVRTRANERRELFEADLRRAPVRMVLPLTLCILPSFALLTVVPMLRGMDLHP